MPPIAPSVLAGTDSSTSPAPSAPTQLTSRQPSRPTRTATSPGPLWSRTRAHATRTCSASAAPAAPGPASSQSSRHLSPPPPGPTDTATAAGSGVPARSTGTLSPEAAAARRVRGSTGLWLTSGAGPRGPAGASDGLRSVAAPGPAPSSWSRAPYWAHPFATACSGSLASSCAPGKAAPTRAWRRGMAQPPPDITTHSTPAGARPARVAAFTASCTTRCSTGVARSSSLALESDTV
mmetsp:Transcript_17322/g.58095  ORF Transcript_17322/g.58095 Transcript_17322/m.58095 type:complete len:236 (-) Transcript_17322:261-968(-)